MRLLVLTTGYPRWDGDVAGVFVEQWCVALARRGHEIQVLAPADGEVAAPGAGVPAGEGGPARAGAGAPVEGESGQARAGAGAPARASVADREGAPAAVSSGTVAVARFRYARRPRLCYGAGLRDNLRDPRAALQLPALVASMTAAAVRAARAFRPDVVVSHWVGPATVAGRLAASAARAPHLAVLHSEGPARARIADAFADAVVAVSPAAGGRWPIVPLGVELPPLPPRHEARARLGLGRDRFVVLGLGRLARVKGFDRLPAAAPAGSVVLIAGEGPERAALEAAVPAARARGVEVVLLGAVAGARKADALVAADVLCVPSRSEGLPLAIREGQRVGLPIVATAVGAIPQVVTDGWDGLIVPPGDEAALAAALEALGRDPQRRQALGEGSFRRGRVEALEWERVAADWERVLARAVAASGRGRGRAGARAAEAA